MRNMLSYIKLSLAYIGVCTSHRVVTFCNPIKTGGNIPVNITRICYWPRFKGPFDNTKLYMYVH